MGPGRTCGLGVASPCSPASLRLPSLLGGAGHMPLPSLPPEFMQAVAHQITQQAMAAAASAAAGKEAGTDGVGGGGGNPCLFPGC